MSAAEPIETTAEPVDAPSAEIVPIASAALDTHEVRDPVTGSYLPVPAEWQIILQQADVLARAELVPNAYRKKPENIVLATLAGRPFGWDAAMSMRSFHIIEGVPTMKPEIMLALIRKAGHKVNGDTSWEGATITGTRGDTGESMTTKFTINDAVRAGLCTLDSNGQPFSRSSTGKPLPWEQYPEDMCWARALSKLGRRLFTDVFLGVAYVPEEFMDGGQYDEFIEVGEVPTPTWAQPKAPPPEPEPADETLAQELTDRARALPADGAEVLRGMFLERQIRGSFFSQTAAKLKVVEAIIFGVEKRASAGEWGEWTKPAPDNVDSDGVKIEAENPAPDDTPALTAADVDETWDATMLARLDVIELVKVDPAILMDACQEWGVEIPDPATPLGLATAFDLKAQEGF